MAEKNISVKVNFISSGMGVSKVPLAVAGSGVIAATDDTLRITSVRPSLNWNALGGLVIAIVAIVATFKTGKTWMAVTGIGIAIGAGFLPKRAGTKQATKEFPWSKVRNVRLGDPEAKAHSARGVGHSEHEILWFEVKEGINWKSVKAVPAAGAGKDFIEFASSRIG